MRGLADKAFRAGFNVVLLNQRNCGGTEQHGPGLYHSGLTADADLVIRALTDTHGIGRVFVARLLARRQPRAEARGRVRRGAAAPAARRGRGVTGHGSGGLRRRARTAPEHRLPVELRARPAGPHAAQGGALSRALRRRAAGPHLDASGPSTRPTRRRISASPAPPTTTTAPARSASSTASACRR